VTCRTSSFTGKSTVASCFKEVFMYANYAMPHRYSKLTWKGYVIIALVCLLIASTFGA